MSIAWHFHFPGPGGPGARPEQTCLPAPIAAEPARQPTTKRRKRKNSTSSTSNSSAGNAANSAGSKKKTAAANLSLSSQVPVSLAFLVGCDSRLCRLPIPGGGGRIKDSSLQRPSGPAGRRWGGGRGRQTQDLGGRGRKDSVLKPAPANWDLESNSQSLCCSGAGMKMLSESQTGDMSPKV